MQNSRAQEFSLVQMLLPPFWIQNPQVPFRQIKAQIYLDSIMLETARYYHVASVLPTDVAGDLSDVLSTPARTTPYQHLKTKVLERFMPSECTRLQQLLSEADLGDRRPSQLLRRMQQLFGDCNVPTHSTQRCSASF
ncbi:uncharacterized protein LOC119435011 [Dermacentor silvarum]|uniref:uncharacterized protein LOC119435011 n=1 Tax=Dermacentor silvarum TaxID=543639 RepID=UPI00189A8E6E|nr:uncharacterized protein LOC119435011 [Dermacentor silvarum]